MLNRQGRPANYREIGWQLGQTPTTVLDYLRRAAADGTLSYEPGFRAIRLTQGSEGQTVAG